jgi:hypothetical protein
MGVAERVCATLECECDERSIGLAAALVGGAAQCSDSELRACVGELSGDEARIDAAVTLLRAECSEGETSRCDTILVLDDALQAFPLEAMPAMRHTPASRVPSLALLGALLARESSLDTALAPRNATSLYYVLNPGGDLLKTQVRAISTIVM